jgi:hypothetical protein
VEKTGCEKGRKDLREGERERETHRGLSKKTGKKLREKERVPKDRARRGKWREESEK